MGRYRGGIARLQRVEQLLQLLLLPADHAVLLVHLVRDRLRLRVRPPEDKVRLRA